MSLAEQKAKDLYVAIFDEQPRDNFRFHVMHTAFRKTNTIDPVLQEAIGINADALRDRDREIEALTNRLRIQDDVIKTMRNLNATYAEQLREQTNRER